MPRSLRDLVSMDDVGDIIGLLRSVRGILARQGRQFEREAEKTAHRVGKQIHSTERHILEDVADVATHVRRIVARKQREFSRTAGDAAQRVQHEAHTAQVNIEETARDIRQRLEDTEVKAEEKVYSELHRRHVARQPVARVVRDRSGENGDVGIFVIGALLGTVIGAIAGLWFAPQSGEVTRHEIEDAVDDVRHKVEGESVEDAMAAGKAEAQRFQQMR